MHFVSVLDIVESIATCVPRPDAWKEEGPLIKAETPPSWGTKSDRAWMFAFNTLNARFFFAFRISEAAAALDQYLHNSEAQSPHWFDCGETGRPKLNDASRVQASAILVHMSSYYDRYARAYQSGLFDNPKTLPHDLRGQGQYKQPEDEQRLREIGFDNFEIISFLTQYRIPHRLPHADDVQNSPLNDTRPISRTVIHSTKEKRNVLDAAIDKAIEQAGGTYLTPDVYLTLKELALSGEPPLTGIVGKNGSLEYWSSKNERESLTKNALDGRLDRRWKKLGLATPRR